MWLVHTSDTRHEGETVLERLGSVRGQWHNESNGDTSVALKKKKKAGQGGQGRAGVKQESRRASLLIVSSHWQEQPRGQWFHFNHPPRSSYCLSELTVGFCALPHSLSHTLNMHSLAETMNDDSFCTDAFGDSPRFFGLKTVLEMLFPPA